MQTWMFLITLSHFERIAGIKFCEEKIDNIRDIHNVTLSPPYLSIFNQSLGLLSPTNPSFSGIRKGRKFLSNPGMKSWNSAFNAQGSKLIIGCVHVSENICSSSEGAQDEKGKTRWNSVYSQNWWFSEFLPPPPLNTNALFCRFLFNLTRFMTKLRVLVLCFPYFTDMSIILKCFETPYFSSWNVQKVIFVRLGPLSPSLLAWMLKYLCTTTSLWCYKLTRYQWTGLGNSILQHFWWHNFCGGA